MLSTTALNVIRNSRQGVLMGRAHLRSMVQLVVGGSFPYPRTFADRSKLVQQRRLSNQSSGLYNNARDGCVLQM